MLPQINANGQRHTKAELLCTLQKWSAYVCEHTNVHDKNALNNKVVKGKGKKRRSMNGAKAMHINITIGMR